MSYLLLTAKFFDGSAYNARLANGEKAQKIILFGMKKDEGQKTTIVSASNTVGPSCIAFLVLFDFNSDCTQLTTESLTYGGAKASVNDFTRQMP